MQIDLSKNSQIIFFGGLIPAISIGLAWVFSQAFPTFPFWIDSVSPIAAYGAIYWIFDKYLWHFYIFRLLRVVEVPDLRGRWVGSQKSSFRKGGGQVEVKAILEITQTFSQIIVRAFYEKSVSESVIANFKQLNGEVYLFYTYDNDPNTLKEGTMQTHKGTVKLKYLPNQKSLMGFYFNSIGNTGDIFLNFKGKTLKFKR